MMVAFHFTYRPKFLQNCQCLLTDLNHSITTKDLFHVAYFFVFLSTLNTTINFKK
jgi:hypothetical protein